MSDPFDPQGMFTFQSSVMNGSLLDAIATANGDRARLNRYQTCWRFFHGAQWDFQREDGDPLVTINYVKPIVEKHVSFLVRRGVLLDVDVPYRDTVLKDVKWAWEQNGGNSLLYRLAQMGSVTGDHFVYVTWRPPTALEKQAYPDIPAYPVIDVVNSAQCFPEWDPEKRGAMTKCRIVKLYYYPKADKPGELELRTVTITLTPDKIIVRRPTADGKAEEDVVSPNLYGEVPVVHWQNLPNASDYYGLSDVLPVIPLQKELNEKSTDISDIVNYHAAPITVVFGAKISTIDKTSKTLWSNLPAEAKVELLSLKDAGGVSLATSYVDQIRTAIHELSNVPEGSLGSADYKGDTGEAMMAKLFPLIERKDMKVATWTPALRSVNRLLIRGFELLFGREYPVGRDAKSGGLIIRVEEKKLNAMGEMVKVVREIYAVEVDPETGAAKEVTADEMAEATKSGTAKEDFVTLTVKDPDGTEKKRTMRKIKGSVPIEADRYRCDPIFPDTLPKDKLAQIQMLSQYAVLGIVDRRWLAEHCPDVDPDEIDAVLRRARQEAAMDKFLEGMLADKDLSSLDAGLFAKLAKAEGDPKRLMAAYADALKAHETILQQEAKAAGEKNTTGKGTESRQVQPGKKRRGEK